MHIKEYLIGRHYESGLYCLRSTQHLCVFFCFQMSALKPQTVTMTGLNLFQQLFSLFLNEERSGDAKVNCLYYMTKRLGASLHSRHSFLGKRGLRVRISGFQVSSPLTPVIRPQLQVHCLLPKHFSIPVIIPPIIISPVIIPLIISSRL